MYSKYRRQGRLERVRLMAAWRILRCVADKPLPFPFVELATAHALAGIERNPTFARSASLLPSASPRPDEATAQRWLLSSH